MYIPTHFAAPSGALAELLGLNALADLISSGPDGLVATPLPLMFVPGEGVGALHGHVARNNPHWRLAARSDSPPGPASPSSVPSLAIVRGPDAYVSPSFYPSAAEHGRVVPTWNYLTVHVHGRLVAHDDPDWTEDVVRRLTGRMEAPRPAPWSVDDAPIRYLTGQLRAIVGIELVITRVEAKYKLSQNRSDADRHGVVEALSTGTGAERAVADRMAPAERIGPAGPGELSTS